MDGTAPDGTPAPQVSRPDWSDYLTAIDPYLTPYGKQNSSQIFKEQIAMSTYQRLGSGIATALPGRAQGQEAFGGYSSAAMQQYQTARYQEMLRRQYHPWNSAVVTATAGYMPSYVLDGNNNAYQTVERAAEVETVPPTVYVTKRLHWRNLGFVCLALTISMATMLDWSRPAHAQPVAHAHIPHGGVILPRVRITKTGWRYFEINTRKNTAYVAGEYFVQEDDGNLYIKTANEIVYQVPWKDVQSFGEITWDQFPSRECAPLTR